ncbi:MAG TPA: DNA polymerase III subunit gamma/tau [Bacillota bacterium]|nr:DNA polymerase III subunit gamma/tau [Bacillota bacterium]
MSYQALYRSWRPRTFKDVVGQGHITQTLQNAISQKRFSHAYLFSGPRGTGKTSTAKIFAQTINCEQMPASEPCNECSACKGILDGSISDVIEIDAASNTSVDDIREIRDKIKYASSSVPYKVYIIDEVHMISINAFNALLKTLEEPPPHVVFILATTEPHKIPLTIISRCQRFDFKPIGNQVIIERMKEIVDAETIDIVEEALESIALTAEGGMRDALSILDQAISYGGETIQLEDVLAVTGSVSQHVLTEMTSMMLAKNTEQALTLLDEMVQEGKDPSRFVYDFIYFLRDLLLFKGSAALEVMLERAVLNDAFKQLANDVSVDWIQMAIMALNECQQEMRWSNSPKVFIEVCILSISQYKGEGEGSAAPNIEVTQLKQRIDTLEKELVTMKEQALTIQAERPAVKQPRQPARRANKNSFNVATEKVRQVLDEAEKSALQEVMSNWAQFLTQLKSTHAPAHASIQDSKPVAASEKAVVVAFEYEIHCSLFADSQAIIEPILATTLDREMTIIPIPKEQWQPLRASYVKQAKGNKSADDQQEEQTDPLVEEARKLVGEDLLHVHDS